MDIQIEITKPGGADVLAVTACPERQPGKGEIRLRQHAVGVNFVDIYHRTGAYPLPSFPVVPGVEGAGIVEAVGQGVDNVRVGERVAYAGLPLGAYAATRLLPAWRAVRLPDDVPFELAAASMLRGLTCAMLTSRIFPVSGGDTVLIHAAAGGLGQYLTRWVKRLGATVIGTVGSESKAEIARKAGADHLIIGRDADYVSQVLALTDGKGVPFVVDGIGGETFARNFQTLQPFGIVASVGQAAGPIPPVAVTALSPKAASLSRPSIIAYINDQNAYRSAAQTVFQMMATGVTATIGGTYALRDAAQAHEDMEAGKTSGSLILLP